MYEVFPENISGPGTLKAIVNEMLLHRLRQLCLPDQKPTVVLDAGIAPKANLGFLRDKGLDYVCVDRRRGQEVPKGDPHVIHDGPSGVVKALRSGDSFEALLFCWSMGREHEKESIESRFQMGFEQDLQRLAYSSPKKRGIK